MIKPLSLNNLIKKKPNQIFHTLDTTGLYCPEPIMLLHQLIKKIQSNEYIWMISTDQSTLRDIPRLCDFLGHVLVKKHEENNFYYYIIEVIK